MIDDSCKKNIDQQGVPITNSLYESEPKVEQKTNTSPLMAYTHCLVLITIYCICSRFVGSSVISRAPVYQYLVYFIVLYSVRTIYFHVLVVPAAGKRHFCFVMFYFPSYIGMRVCFWGLLYVGKVMNKTRRI